MVKSSVKRGTRTTSFLFIIFLLFFSAALISLAPLTVRTVLAADVTLEWDANSEPDIAGYKVYYGLESGNYTTMIDVGMFTSCVVSGLDSLQTYYFAATAYNTDGYESDYSNEVAYGASSSSSSPIPSPSASDSDSGGGGSCFIATAAYGTNIESDVIVLRKFRDRGLLTSAIGKASVRLYYKTSLLITHYVGEHETLRKITRWALIPITYSVKYPMIFGIIFVLLFLTIWIIFRGRRQLPQSV